MKKQFIAHWFLGGSNQDSISADSLDELIPFVKARISATAASLGGMTVCVADLKSRSKLEPWLWRMKPGGHVDYHGKYGKLFNAALR